MTKFELFTIRELVRIYRESSQRILANRRARLISSTIGWTLIAAGFGLAWFRVLDGGFCVLIAAVGGFAVGWSFMFLMNAETIPIVVRYTTLNDEECQKALEGSKDAL